MNILVLGATGRVGKKIVQKGLDHQYSVTAFVRNPEKLGLHSSYLTIFQGDVLNQNDVNMALGKADIVISALSTDKKNTLSRSMSHLIQAMEMNKLIKIITIGTAGILNSRSQDGLYRFQTSESRRKSTTAAEDHLKAYQLLQQSNLEWTIVCPTFMPEGQFEGKFRVGENVLPENGKWISTGDTADFTFSLHDKKIFTQSRVGIAY